VPVVALAQPRQERGHVVLADLADRRTAACEERVDVTPQVAPVGAQGVRRESAVVREVVEVGADLGAQCPSELFTGGGYQRGTSSSES
jgi:hypothetical protein